jgi:hypothetical protein
MKKYESDTFLTKSHFISPKIKNIKINKILEIEPYENNNNFDGLAVQSHRITLTEHLNEIFSPRKKEKNIIFNKPFPLIRVISKRTLLNKTPLFIPKLINCYKRDLLKNDQKLIKSINSKEKIKIKEKKTKIKSLEKYKKLRIMSYNESYKTYNNLRTVGNINNPFNKLRIHSTSHDTNLYNRECILQKKKDFFDTNAFKIKHLINEMKFMNKIKDDISKLKFNNTLRVNSNFKSI